MAKFSTAIVDTLKAEGGFVNDPFDAGGYTYRGITKKNFPTWAGWAKLATWVITHGQPKTGKIFTDAEIPGLETDCLSFYKENFWDKVKGDEIHNQEVAADLFDSAVNMGIHQAVILCQRSLEIAETGKMDSSTLNTLNENNVT
jgi:lysozyme family protein